MQTLDCVSGLLNCLRWLSPKQVINFFYAKDNRTGHKRVIGNKILARSVFLGSRCGSSWSQAPSPFWFVFCEIGLCLKKLVGIFKWEIILVLEINLCFVKLICAFGNKSKTLQIPEPQLVTTLHNDSHDL